MLWQRITSSAIRHSLTSRITMCSLLYCSACIRIEIKKGARHNNSSLPMRIVVLRISHEIEKGKEVEVQLTLNDQ
jgi:hypothetical protein